MNLQLADVVDPQTYDEVVRMLVEYNNSQTQAFQQEINKPLEIIARDEHRQLVGRIYGRSLWGTLEIKTFVVKENYRGHGVGRQLMSAAEEEAKRRGCRFISLDTFSFQAPGFYEKLGFEKVGTETDFPKGFEKYYYRKVVG